MSGSRIGGLKCRDKNISREADFYKRIGKTGGINSHTGGLFGDPERASQIGRVGGSHSKRGYKLIKKDTNYLYYVDNVNGGAVKYYHDGTLANHKRSTKI